MALGKPDSIIRVVGRIPLVRDCANKIERMVTWMTTIHRTNDQVRQICHARRGPRWRDLAVVVEPQGFTAGVTPGMVGVTIDVNGMAEESVFINPSAPGERPRYVDNKAVCLYTPYQSRVFMTEEGDVELGAKLTDYKGTAGLLDEGGKVRALRDGVVEVYSETEVRLRAQPKGGAGPSAVVVLRPDGVLEVTTSGNVVVGAQGSVTVTSQQAVAVQGAAGVVLENEAGARVRLSGADVIVEPGGGGHVRLGGEQGKALAEAERTAARLARVEKALNLHSHAQHGAPPTADANVPLSLTVVDNVSVTKVVAE